jgi:hypothetical protein
LIKVTLRNPLDYNDKIAYTIKPYDSPVARLWTDALTDLLQSNCLLEKNFCFMGFPKTARNLELLCKDLNDAIFQINMFNSSLGWIDAGLPSYVIEEYFTPDTVRFGTEYPISKKFHKDNNQDTYMIENLGLQGKKEILNKLHNHFEILQGTVDKLSQYYIIADYETKYAIRQLNVICHEIETLILSQQKQSHVPEWSRPSQITTWLNAKRIEFPNEFKKTFDESRYDRKFGEVYLHWSQIGKTLYEVYRDEQGVDIDEATCEAITHLEYYSGEFDVEWAKDVTFDSPYIWHKNEMIGFRQWLTRNRFDVQDAKYNYGYHPVGQVDLLGSFGTTDMFTIWELLSNHLDIYEIEIDGVKQTFEYCWSDLGYKQMQIDIMKPGYDFNSRR